MSNPYQPMTLVEYHGGGYDGCIWEANFCFFDSFGDFYDVYSSGVMGCDTVEKLAKAKGIKTYNLGSEADRLKFADEVAVGKIRTVAAWFKDNFPDIVITPQCVFCEIRFDVNDTPEGASVPHDTFICEKCREQFTCTNCQECFGPNHIFRSSKHYSHACECCFKQDGPDGPDGGTIDGQTGQNTSGLPQEIPG